VQDSCPVAHPDDPTAERAPERAAGPKDVAWALFGSACGALFLLNVFGALVLLARQDFALLWNAPVGLLVAYWFAAGAWRRTVWGRRRPRVAPHDPPVLSNRTTKLYLYLAAACAVALALALAGQILVARAG